MGEAVRLDPSVPVHAFAALGLARLLARHDYALQVGFVFEVGGGVRLEAAGDWACGLEAAVSAEVRALAAAAVAVDGDGVSLGRLRVRASEGALCQAQAALRASPPEAALLFDSPAVILLAAVGRASWPTVRRGGRFCYWLWRPAVSLAGIGAAWRGDRPDLAIGAWSFAEGDLQARAERMSVLEEAR